MNSIGVATDHSKELDLLYLVNPDSIEYEVAEPAQELLNDEPVFEPLSGALVIPDAEIGDIEDVEDVEEETKVDDEPIFVDPFQPVLDPSSTVDQMIAGSITAEQQIDNLMESLTGFSNEHTDLLYVTSISFLVIFTIAGMSALMSYRNMSRLPEKQKQALRDTPPGNENNGVLASAFDWISNPVNYNIFYAMQVPYNTAKYGIDTLAGLYSQHGPGSFDTPQGALNLNYSSTNQSEDENSALINILDRKRYNEKLAATKSAEDQFQQSFFEKISTGCNTDSDLRFIRFDANGRIEEVKDKPQDDLTSLDGVPKFRKPVPSKN